MKCHYTYVVENGKKKRYFIPHCMGGEFHGMSGCTCKDSFSFKSFEKKEYNEEIKRLNECLKELYEENKHLLQLIKELKEEL